MSFAPHQRLLYRQNGLPIFQNRMYDSSEEARTCPTGDMALVEDRLTGLVYNAAFRSDVMVYDGHYQNEQATSPLFQRHLDAVSETIDRTMGRDRLVEVGCGKGFFLEVLLANGFDITGFDPTYEGDNPRIRRHYFEPGLGIKADGLILRHVLEHIKDPVAFLKTLADANGGKGKIYIEVPCFDWICEHRAWFDIFHEHVNYFRLSDFRAMFGNVVEAGHCFGGQYIYVVGDLSSLRSPVFRLCDEVRFPPDFAGTVLSCEDDMSPRNAVWGGASKGVIFSLIRQRAGRPVEMVIDINPSKQGKYLAATGIRVSSPAEALAKLDPGSTVYVMNSNYLDEIRALSNNAFCYVAIDRLAGA